jgi:hypothetical protein
LYFRRTKYCYVTTYDQNSVEEIADEIMNLAGNTKTKPANRQTVEDYLKEPQPHLKYLLNASETEQKIALRIWASTEGFISINKDRRNKCLYPVIGIACAHPGLTIQLKHIAHQFNFNLTKINFKDAWSGIRGLRTSALSSCIGFLKLGGFIKGVKISSHSKYHEGIDKDILLLGILEFKKYEQIKPRLRTLSRKQIHYEVNKLIKNGKYKSEDYYINYFSEN